MSFAVCRVRFVVRWCVVDCCMMFVAHVLYVVDCVVSSVVCDLVLFVVCC